VRWLLVALSLEQFGQELSNVISPFTRLNRVFFRNRIIFALFDKFSFPGVITRF
jgi:hypothetical protein